MRGSIRRRAKFDGESEEPLLTSAARRLRDTATDGLVAGCQHRLLMAKLLHAALQGVCIAALQLHAEADECIDEERPGGELAASAGQLVQDVQHVQMI